MTSTVQTISLIDLSLSFLPVLIVIIILWHWSLDYLNSIYAVSRMLVQLLLIGYFLTYIFKSDSTMIVSLVIAIMIFVSSWIALGTVREQRTRLYTKALFSIALGGGIILGLVTEGVLNLDPWYLPQYMIPLAGMIFANAMNCVSLSAERFFSEMKSDNNYFKSRNIAFNASLIPNVNSLFAVGLVSLPGMMTGQILSGVDPLIAARYQIMVMCMIYGSAGISTAIFLTLIKFQSITEQTVPDNNAG
jgi:putative ABC transport system permease protein